MNDKDKVDFINEMERFREIEQRLSPNQRQRFFDWVEEFLLCYKTLSEKKD